MFFGGGCSIWFAQYAYHFEGAKFFFAVTLKILKSISRVNHCCNSLLDQHIKSVGFLSIFQVCTATFKSSVVIVVCLRSLFCCKVNPHPNLKSLADQKTGFPQELPCIQCCQSSILTSFPVLASGKHPHGMLLPPSCFTVGMVFLEWWKVLGLHHI